MNYKLDLQTVPTVCIYFLSIYPNTAIFFNLPYNQGMTKAQLIQKAGAIKHLAVLLGISKAAISQWKDVPEQRIWQLKVMRPEWFL